MVFRDEIAERLFSKVLTLTGISRREILADIREHQVLEARFAMVLALRKHGLKTESVGKVLNRERTTVGSAIESARKWYDTKPNFRALVDEVMGDDNIGGKND